MPSLPLIVGFEHHFVEQEHHFVEHLFSIYNGSASIREKKTPDSAQPLAAVLKRLALVLSCAATVLVCRRSYLPVYILMPSPLPKRRIRAPLR
jgi:hypothetical protein